MHATPDPTVRPVGSPTASVLPPLLLIGCGNMGGAMFHRWNEAGLSASVVIRRRATEPVPPPHRAVTDPDAVPDGFAPALVVLAVKPQVAPTMLPSVAARFGDRPLLSIMAGRRIEGLRALGWRGPIVRAMPNTPAAIGHGVSGLHAEPDTPEAVRALAAGLLDLVGQTVTVADEASLDAVTAVSGSGPAYVFLLAELLEDAAIASGLAPDAARTLARATVSGAGRLLEQDGRDADALRRAVTSPGGTTEAALAVLRAPKAWPALVRDAVRAGADRARALAS